MKYSTRHLMPQAQAAATALAPQQPPSLEPSPDPSSTGMTPVPSAAAPAPTPVATRPALPTGAHFDIALEASKIPLHIAIIESIASAAVEDKMKRYFCSLIVVGGVAATHHTGFAIESRCARSSLGPADGSGSSQRC